MLQIENEDASDEASNTLAHRLQPLLHHLMTLMGVKAVSTRIAALVVEAAGRKSTAHEGSLPPCQCTSDSSTASPGRTGEKACLHRL